ncbi:MAG TPA: hypothetical protein VK900_22020 [Anaerolineales bacterium]|nr:hypothetical protein [Anaerolineales bacterium]
MPREFYTERDIEELVQRGTKSLRITENVFLTELAYEKAQSLGLQLISGEADNPPSAPVRPYLSEAQARQPKPTISPAPSAVESQPATSLAPAHIQSASENQIQERIRSAVIARLGNQVDAKLLDNIIHRVVKSVGLK